MTTKTQSAVVAKLQAHKEANTGTYEVPLKKSGVVCTVPKFINHGLWMRAQRIGKGDIAKSQAAYITETVQFEGEKITLTDLSDMVPAADSLQLINELFGGEDDADSEGKASKTAS